MTAQTDQNSLAKTSDQGKTLVLTRPKSRSDQSTQFFQSAGYSVVAAPMQSVVYSGIDFPENTSALVFTSVNGVNALSSNGAASISKDMSVYCVGDVTAAAAKDYGFNNITIGQGNAQSLVPIITASDLDGTVVHLSGQDLAFNMVSALQAMDMKAHRIICYHMQDLTRLEPILWDQLRNKRVRVLFYSVGAAVAFEKQLGNAHMQDILSTGTAVCLSDRVATGLNLDWSHVLIASEPTDQAMLNILKTI